MKRILLCLALLALAVNVSAKSRTNGAIIDWDAQAVKSTPQFDVSDMDRFSLQAIYGDGTPSAHTLSTGGKSGAQITVVSTSGLTSATIGINGVTLTNGTDFTSVSTASGTAKAISDAIVAHATLGSIITSTWTAGGVVYATSTYVGTNAYSLTTSTYAALRPSGFQFTGGSDSDISQANDTFYEATHGITTGLAVLVSTPGSGTLPSPLIGGTTYYGIKVDANYYKLATTTTTAVAGAAVDISSPIGSTTVTVTPLSLDAGSAGFKWQVSNDNSNWTDLSVSSITYSAAGTYIWDMGAFNYRYLRLDYTAPTSGGLSLSVYQAGKRDD
jgi:hypothetical protein